MSKTKVPKLSATQQEVVNLMAEGWELHWSREAFGGRIPASAWLCRGDVYRSGKIRSDTPLRLEQKGIVAHVVARNRKSFIPDWLYELTPLGHSLATST